MAMPAWHLGLSCLTLRSSWLSPAAHKHVSTMTIIMAVLMFASLGTRRQAEGICPSSRQ